MYVNVINYLNIDSILDNLEIVYERGRWSSIAARSLLWNGKLSLWVHSVTDFVRFCWRIQNMFESFHSGSDRCITFFSKRFDLHNTRASTDNWTDENCSGRAFQRSSRGSLGSFVKFRLTDSMVFIRNDPSPPRHPLPTYPDFPSTLVVHLSGFNLCA